METPTPHLNGHHPAPLPSSSGALYSSQPASPSQRAPTTFPPEIAGWSPRLLSYWLGWAQWGEIALMRWLWVAGILFCIGLAIAPFPGKLWLISLVLALLAALSLVRPFLARSHFVRFVPTPEQANAEPAIHQPLSPAQKVPVHVTGILDVNERQQRFVALPGFYRTFATREHALLCQCSDRRILGIGVPPERDLGLWFAFFDASRLLQIERGTIAPGSAPLPTLRITYEARHVRQRGVATGVNTLYVSCATLDELALVESDLFYDFPAATPAGANVPAAQAAATKA